jgi:hypothetical protein
MKRIIAVAIALLVAIMPLVLLNVITTPPVKAEFVPDANTLALWHFNEGNGQVVHDASAHSNDGTLGPTLNVENRDPSWATGMTGLPGDYALSFDDWYDYVRVPDNPDGSLNLQSSQWTIEFYAYSREISRSDRGSGYHWNWFFGKQVDISETTGYIVHQCTYHPAFSCYFFTGPSWKNVGFKDTPSVHQWVYFRITYDGQYLKIYFDDVLEAQSNTGSFTVAGNTNPLTLGKSLIDDMPWHDSVDCIMDEVRISNVVRGTNEPYYWKPSYADYAPSGMPDFDQRQWGTYNWVDLWGAWSHCGPVAVANSLWWLDSEYEPNQSLPPVISDGFPLVKSYSLGVWDDHDPLNVPPLVEHLAFLMDTDGRRTGLAHSGTNVNDMQAGLTHYLSWTGVNPKGDVNGDGIVNMTDIDLVAAAFGSKPGMAGWNMACDVSVTTSYPPTTNNKIDASDVYLVALNIWKTGLFYEHTVNQPDFSYVEMEVEKCQDVVLLIGYWMWTGSSWYREPGGHYVTVAGIDSTDMMMAISDPVQDAFETGMIPQGRIPIPHPHLPPEPPYITHNDASLVSQDIYNAVYFSPPFPPCPGGTWALNNFASWRPMPPYFAVVEAAVVTSEIPHDVAVTNVTTIKTGCVPCETVCKGMNMEVYVTVKNHGFWNETFDVTVYANSTAFGVQTVKVDADQSTTLTFVWNTSSAVEYENYTIGAIASMVIGESDLTDNSFTDGTLTVTHMGDITGDGKVEIADLSRVNAAYGSVRVNDPLDPKYGQYWHPPKIPPCPTCPHTPNTDVTGDRKVEIADLSRTSGNFGWHL